MDSVNPQLVELEKLKIRLKALCSLRKALNNNETKIASSFVLQGMKLDKFYVTTENFGPIVAQKLEEKDVKEVVLCKVSKYEIIIEITDFLINKLKNGEDINSINKPIFEKFIKTFKLLQSKYKPVYEALTESVRKVKDTTRKNQANDILRNLQQHLLNESGAAEEDPNHETKLDLIRRWCVASLNMEPPLEEQEHILELLNINAECRNPTLTADEMQEIYNSVMD